MTTSSFHLPVARAGGHLGSTVGAAALVALLVGCGPEPQAPATPQQGNTAAPLPSLAQLVVDDLRLPQDGSRYTYEPSGQPPRNRLGVMIAALASVLPDIDLQGIVRRQLQRRKTVMLLELFGGSYERDLDAHIHGYLGADADGDPGNDLSGRGSFAVDPDSPATNGLRAEIVRGRILSGPGDLVVPSPFGWRSEGSVHLRKAGISGTLAHGQLRGVLTGLVAPSELASKLVGVLAVELDAIYRTADKDSLARRALGALFDSNRDGRISAAELQKSAALRLALQPDVDSDGDGRADMVSFGVGFHAQPCSIVQ